MSKHPSKPASSHPKPKGKAGAGQGTARQAPKMKPVSKTIPTLPKHVSKTIPTLPKHEFPQPYSRLLLIGEHELEEVQHIYEEIASMLKASAPREAVARLTAMALDESYYDYEDVDHPDPKETRTWTRLHAIGVLCFMGEAASASVEPLLPLLDDEDDWLREEMPLFYASVGEPAIEPLRHLLQDPDEATFMRTGAGDSLEQIAETHTALRPAILPLLEQALVDAGEDTLLAAFLVCNLLDLNAKESFALIQQAFEEQRVDESVVEIRDVEEHFGLVSTNPISRQPVSPNSASPKLRYTSSSTGEFALPGKWEDWEEGGEEENWEPEEVTIQDVSEQPDTTNENTADVTVTSVPFVKPVKLGRNEPCWCGSGKKYKQCHG